jgi:inositol hexakisphosphate/diphosphoinositol-pentakisphosphate kinase
MLAKKKPQVHHGFSTNKALCISVQNFSIGQHNAAVTLEEGAEPVRNMSNVDPSATLESPMFDDESTSSKGTTKGTQETHQEELRCVLTVVRHGDRTPKQKLKVKLSEPQLLHYFHKYSDNCKQELKVKDKQPLSEFLDTINDIVEAMEKDDTRSEPDEVYEKVLHMRDILQKWKIGGLNRKLQMKPTKWNEYITDDGSKFLKCSQVQLILKWGGNLTKLGEKQAINLGQRFRNEMYPQGDGGILRLHSTFRHDLKIKTSDEGRVMKTAAAFAKGLLELEGEIPPILVSLVHKEKNSHHMLDPSGNKEVKKILETCKKRINTKLQEDIDVSQMSGKELEPFVGPKGLLSLHSALRKVGNPRKVLFEIRVLIGKLLVEIEAIKSEKENEHEGGEGLKCDDENDEALCGIKLYKGETMRELKERWRLLYTKLYDEEKDKFDLSRIPDVHDNARFDMLHNPETWHRQTLEDLYHKAKLMADCVVPQEYGTSIKQKREIGSKMCGPLLMKIK